MAIRPRILNPILFVLAIVIAACPAVPRTDGEKPTTVTFAIVAPEARTVAVAGTFNRWDANSHPLSGPDRHGRWAETVPLPPGRYEYLFIVNGTEWVPDALAPSVDNGLGGRNSVVTVPGDQDGLNSM
jgi:1,4-alpha-glucan branching enzyme